MVNKAATFIVNVRV